MILIRRGIERAGRQVNLRSAASPYLAMGKRKNSSKDSTESPQWSEAPPISPSVQKVFDSYHDVTERRVLLDLRNLIFATAQTDHRIGPLTETLKWGEPAYLTETTKAGSTLRLGHSKLSDSPALFVSCSTPLLKTLQQLDTADALSYHGLRDIAVPEVTADNKAMLQTVILRTLTYHLDKKNAIKPSSSPVVKAKKQTATEGDEE